MELLPPVVRVPRGSGVSSVGVSRPECQAEVAAQVLAAGAMILATSSWVAFAEPLSMAP